MRFSSTWTELTDWQTDGAHIHPTSIVGWIDGYFVCQCNGCNERTVANLHLCFFYIAYRIYTGVFTYSSVSLNLKLFNLHISISIYMPLNANRSLAERGSQYQQQNAVDAMLCRNALQSTTLALQRHSAIYSSEFLLEQIVVASFVHK